MKSTRAILAVAMIVANSMFLFAEAPKLNLKTSGTPCELQMRLEIERLAAKYDLSKFTITRDITIEQDAVAHSYPVLTLNCRFLGDDDLALSQYVHEQGHWVLMQRHRADMPRLYNDLKRMFPDLPIQPPQGDGAERSTYFHVAVNLLEWEALEDLIGPQRALKVMQWKQRDHYTAIYSAVLHNREKLEDIMKRYRIDWEPVTGD